MSHPIRKYMTSPVRTIRSTSTLAEAHRWMNELGVRHLPVYENRRLVGLVSQRDLHLVETLKDVDPQIVPVEEAMSQDAFVVTPDTPLAEVCQRMADRKLGSVVVVDGGEVVGIFTTVDACRALGTLLAAKKPARGATATARAAKEPAAKAAAKRTAKVPAKKAAGKKPPVRKPAAKKPVAKKATAEKAATKATAARKVAAKRKPA
ncbi:MAG TPA: CBS domain-containing protein [Vulgatibacter sp.]|nr:CBS domain-containing protein [Vulgatibacter sp.]